MAVMMMMVAIEACNCAWWGQKDGNDGGAGDKRVAVRSGYGVVVTVIVEAESGG